MALGTGHITTTTAGSFSPTIYAREYIESFRKNLPALSFFTDRSKFRTTEGKGQAVLVPKPAAFTKNDKVVGSPVTFNNATTTSATITLNQHYEVSFLIERGVSALTRDEMVKAYIEEAVAVKMDAVDAYILSLASGFTSTVAATSNTGDNLYANFLAARKTLNTEAPMTDRGWFLDVDLESRCLNMTQFTSALYRGSQPVQTGDTGGAQFLGAAVFLAPNVPSATVTATTDTNFLAHKSAIAYIIALDEFIEAPASDYLGTQYTAHILFGASVMVAGRGVKLTTTY